VCDSSRKKQSFHFSGLRDDVCPKEYNVGNSMRLPYLSHLIEPIIVVMYHWPIFIVVLSVFHLLAERNGKSIPAQCASGKSIYSKLAEEIKLQHLSQRASSESSF